MKKEICSYCSTLKKGIVGDDYCSINDVKSPIDSVGNSFYIKAKSLSSGKHISRLTFRGVLNGYQHYEINNQEFMVNSDNYLIVEKGASYISEIESVAPIESIIVAFSDHIDVEVNRALKSSQEHLLDSPFHSSRSEETKLQLHDNSYPRNARISSILQVIKKFVDYQNMEPLFFEQLHYSLMTELIINQSKIMHRLNSIEGLKKSTRIELYRRTGRAKDYMDANFTKKLNLNDISDEACMSSYHFLRTFKKIYHITPIEYLINARLKYAKYLLSNSNISVHEIVFLCGFESHSSFSRLFKSRYNIQPTNFRIKERN